MRIGEYTIWEFLCSKVMNDVQLSLDFTHRNQFPGKLKIHVISCLRWVVDDEWLLHYRLSRSAGHSSL